jgi:hypothetical protein
MINLAFWRQSVQTPPPVEYVSGYMPYNFFDVRNSTLFISDFNRNCIIEYQFGGPVPDPWYNLTNKIGFIDTGIMFSAGDDRYRLNGPRQISVALNRDIAVVHQGGLQVKYFPYSGASRRSGYTVALPTCDKILDISLVVEGGTNDGLYALVVNPQTYPSTPSPVSFIALVKYDIYNPSPTNPVFIQYIYGTAKQFPSIVCSPPSESVVQLTPSLSVLGSSNIAVANNRYGYYLGGIQSDATQINLSTNVPTLVNSIALENHSMYKIVANTNDSLGLGYSYWTGVCTSHIDNYTSILFNPVSGGTIQQVVSTNRTLYSSIDRYGFFRSGLFMMTENRLLQFYNDLVGNQTITSGLA